jgi:hypothetical protein
VAHQVINPLGRPSSFCLEQQHLRRRPCLLAVAHPVIKPLGHPSSFCLEQQHLRRRLPTRCGSSSHQAPRPSILLLPRAAASTTVIKPSLLLLLEQQHPMTPMPTRSLWLIQSSSPSPIPQALPRAAASDDIHQAIHPPCARAAPSTTTPAYSLWSSSPRPSILLLSRAAASTTVIKPSLLLVLEQQHPMTPMPTRSLWLIQSSSPSPIHLLLLPRAAACDDSHQAIHPPCARAASTTTPAYRRGSPVLAHPSPPCASRSSIYDSHQAIPPPCARAAASTLDDCRRCCCARQNEDGWARTGRATASRPASSTTPAQLAESSCPRPSSCSSFCLAQQHLRQSSSHPSSLCSSSSIR